MLTRLLLILVLACPPQTAGARAPADPGGAPRRHCPVPPKAFPLALRYREEARRRIALGPAAPSAARGAPAAPRAAAAQAEAPTPPRPSGRVLCQLLQSLQL
jgi:hypothetical protein